jgi:TPR repeat protein
VRHKKLAWAAVALLGAMNTTSAQTDNAGMKKVLERLQALRPMLVCADLKRQAETGPRDPKDLAFVQEAALANAPACLLLLGRWTERGEGVPRDLGQAKALYERAAVQDRKGHVELGRMAEQGIAGPVSYAQAWDHYSQAAAKNDTDALVALGRMTEQGLGRPADEREAVAYYRRAAQRWNDQAWAKLDRLQSDHAVMSAEDVDQERKRWRSVLALRSESVYDKSPGLAAFKDFPYQVTLRFAFRRGEGTPAWVRVNSPSKSPDFDHALQDAMMAVQMPPPPIFGPGESFEADLTVRFSANDK